MTNQAGFFQSFTPGNFELGVRMVDACGLPQNHPQRGYWTFYGGLTNAGTEMSITQLATGSTDSWTVEPKESNQLASDGVPAFDCE